MYDIKEVVVAYPKMQQVSRTHTQAESRPIITFIYPAFPRVFKNIEIVADAATLLYDEGITGFEVLFTIAGGENRYAHHLVDKYKRVPVISFIGIQSRENIFTLYQQAHALIFPSKLETWGLPISEFKCFGKPLLLADLPYAHETVGDYEKVKFFDPGDPRQLAAYMGSLIKGDLVYDGNRAVPVENPFARDWDQLFTILLSSKG